MDLDVCGHCTIDTVSVGGSQYRQIGGPACYCGCAARSLKFGARLHTRFGPDFPGAGYLDGLGIRHEGARSDSPTTRFRIDVRGTERDLYLESRCGPIAYADSGSDGLVASPVLDEITPEAFSEMRRGPRFTLLDPRGFLRRAGPGGRVLLEKADVDLSGVSAIKVGPGEMDAMVGSSDVGGMRLLQKRGAGYVIRTDGTRVSLLDGDRLYSLELPNREIRDTTGVGDIFSATFACTMLRERDAIWALCFAGGSAQAALETAEIGLQKVPKRGATSTNASYFYNTLDFRQV